MLRNVLWKLCTVFQWNTRSLTTEKKRKKVVEEVDNLELEFSEANEKAQEYVDARKDELSNLATEASENTRRRRITEGVAKKSAEQIRRDEIKHTEKFDDCKESLRELNRHYKEALTPEVENLRKNRTKSQRLFGICGNN